MSTNFQNVEGEKGTENNFADEHCKTTVSVPLFKQFSIKHLNFNKNGLCFDYM